MCGADVVKSRVQLRNTPPVGTPVQYIAHELKEIVVEARSWVPFGRGSFQSVNPLVTGCLACSGGSLHLVRLTAYVPSRFWLVDLCFLVDSIKKHPGRSEHLRRIRNYSRYDWFKSACCW